MVSSKIEGTVVAKGVLWTIAKCTDQLCRQ